MSSALVSTASRSVVSPALGLATAGAAGAKAAANNAEKEKGWWIPDGYAAVRTRFGRAVFKHNQPVVKFPGFHPNMPFSHANKFINTKDQTSSLGHVAIRRQGELTLVHATATWGVVPNDPEAVHAAWLKVKEGELGERFAAACGGAFNLVMSIVPVGVMEEVAEIGNEKTTWESANANNYEGLSEELKAQLDRKKTIVAKITDMTRYVAHEELSEVGLELRRINLRSDAPHPFTQIGVNSGAAAVATEEMGGLTGGIDDGTVVSIAGA